MREGRRSTAGTNNDLIIDGNITSLDSASLRNSEHQGLSLDDLDCEETRCNGVVVNSPLDDEWDLFDEENNPEGACVIYQNDQLSEPQSVTATSLSESLH